MKKERKDKHFIHKPFYEGGPQAARDFIRAQLTYPKAAIDQRIEGTVTVRYTINHEGQVVEAHAISGIGHGCDEEAIRVVKLMKFTVPKNRGVRVQFHQTRHIHFKLPKKKYAKIQYNITPSKSPEKSRSYTYSIQIKDSD